MRPFRFAIHLKEFGWEPVVLTIEAKGQRLTQKEARLLEGIEVIPLKPPFDASGAAESQLGLSPEQILHGASPSLSRRLFRSIDRHFPIDTWLLLFLARYRTLVHIVRRVRPHVIWSTGDPWSGLVISQRLARQLRTPWVADFRDPWTLCRARTEGRWAVSRAIDRYCERRVLETADVVLFQAKHTEEKYRKHYADLGVRTTTIYNSYDPAVFEDPVALQAYTPFAVSPDEDLNIGFFGRFRALSPASLIVDILERARHRHGSLAERLRIHSFGPLNEADARYAEEKGVLHHFRHREAVPLEKALSVLRQFDLLLLSTDPQRDEIIPAKLFEYLAAARPILSLSRNPEVAEILSRTGAGIQPALEEKERIADLLVESLRAKQESRPLPVPFDFRPEEIRRFEARATTQDLAALFESVLEAARPSPTRTPVSSFSQGS